MVVADEYKILFCIGKIRTNSQGKNYLEKTDGSNIGEVNTSDKIVGYTMRTKQNKIVNISADEVREGLMTESIKVTNLKLDSTGRIISYKPKSQKSILEHLTDSLSDKIDFQVIQFKQPLTNEEAYKIKQILDSLNQQQSNRKVLYKIDKQYIKIKEQ
jgi:hypothetical protein